MQLEFDPTKDEINRAKHGISLARAVDLDIHARLTDDRHDEPRYRLFGYIDGVAYCLAATYRNGVLRAISLRRARHKEMLRHVGRD